jgi:hypothetical protein
MKNRRILKALSMNLNLRIENSMISLTKSYTTKQRRIRRKLCKLFRKETALTGEKEFRIMDLQIKISHLISVE